MYRRIKPTMRVETLERKPEPVHNLNDNFALLTDDDRHWFNEGTNCPMFQKMGAHLVEKEGAPGTCFSVWSPNAEQVFVMGDFNGWNKTRHPLLAAGNSGIWSGFVPKLGQGATYKYHIVSRHSGFTVDKADPYGFFHQTAPKTASLVWNPDCQWNDAEWMKSRGPRQSFSSRISIYEMHLGSWRRAGDTWQKFANLRLLLAYRWAQPGKKLLFMGWEFGQWKEWDHESSLDRDLVQDGNPHNGLQKLLGHLSRLYRHEPALQEGDAKPAGFEWVDSNDAGQSTLGFLRKSERTGDLILAVFNFTPVPRSNARVGVPQAGFWREILNTNAKEYGGTGQGNQGGIETAPLDWHFKPHTLHLTSPPLGAVFFKHEGKEA
jgi:1,4-alpha-glucan branching enzyme